MDDNVNATFTDAEAIRQAITDFQERAARKPVVLVIDDEPHILNVLSQVLSHYGIDAKLASNSVSAIGIYKRHQNQIDAALIDVQMPDLDGPSILNLLRTVNPSLKANFMTGFSKNHTQEDLQLLSGRPVIEKPFRGLDFVAISLWKTIEEASK